MNITTLRLFSVLITILGQSSCTHTGARPSRWINRTAMRTKPTEVRVVETAEEGGSASIVRTVAHLDPKTYPTGTIDLNGNFEEGKHYAAVVTLRDARPLVSRLPIQVRESAGIQLTFIAGAMFLIAVVLGALYPFANAARPTRLSTRP